MKTAEKDEGVFTHLNGTILVCHIIRSDVKYGIVMWMGMLEHSQLHFPVLTF